MNHQVAPGLSALAKFVTFASAIMLVGVTAAFASDPNTGVTTEVSLTQGDTPGVVRSTATQPTYAQYSVKITGPNLEGFGLVNFTASTNVVAGSGSTADFVASSLPPACTPALSSTTAFSCIFPPPTSAGGYIAFNVAVKAPIAGSSISVKSTTNWQTSGVLEPERTASAMLGAPDPLSAKSFVPSNTQVTLSTGGGCAYSPLYVGCPATPNVPWTTTVIIPPSAASTTATVTDDNVAACTPDLVYCHKSTLRIPGTFASLEIRVRRDASTLKNNGSKKIHNARITYQPDAGHENPSLAGLYPIDVPACTDSTYGALPKPGIPCIASRIDYTKKTVPNHVIVPAGFGNDWEFIIKALDNGRYLF